jgi:cortactin
MDALRQEVLVNEQQLKQRQAEQAPRASQGYGGKFGVQTDRKDKVGSITTYGTHTQSAETWEYQPQVAKHQSQKDYAKGFGGKYGVETDKKDKNAEGVHAKTPVFTFDENRLGV